MMTDSSSTPTMTLTLRAGKTTHLISFDFTGSDTKTPAQIEALRSRIYRATDRWLNLCQASLSVAKQKQATSSKT